MMRKCLIVVLSAALGAMVGVLMRNIPSAGWSASAAAGPAAKTAAPAPKPTTQPKDESSETPGEDPDAWKARRSIKPLTEEQEKEALDYLKQKRPEIYQQLLEQREKDPRRYRGALRSMWHFISRIKDLPEKVRNAHETRQVTYLRMWRLARQHEDAKTPDAKQDIEKQLYELADEQFDADQIIREHRLAQLADQIKQLEGELKDRARDRKVVVRETVERLMKSAAHYGEKNQKGQEKAPAGRAGSPAAAGPEKKGEGAKDKGPWPKPVAG